MKVYIAEKPELARAIVEAVDAKAKRSEGYFTCFNGDVVTWCYGHMLQLCEPEEYDKKYEKWKLDDLPMKFIPWRKKVIQDKKKQVATIGQLLKRSHEVVHAGDPDDEGQLLVDEILQHFKYKGIVKRLLINDNNADVVKRALATMKNNDQFKTLSAAAEARGVADQLFGYNMTRACTLTAQKRGFSGVLSVGRVQTPILGLVVRRERLNKEHKKSFYYQIGVEVAIDGLRLLGKYCLKDTDPVDDKARIVSKDFAENIVQHLAGENALVKSIQTTEKSVSPLLPYNLLKLQIDCSRKFNLTPDQVKQITQELREKYKLITYNRSDCQYLSDEQHADAAGVLKAIAMNSAVLAKVATLANPALKSRAFNSKKVSAHHAIIPTQSKKELSALPDIHAKVYNLIARSYVAQFYPAYIFDQTEIVFEIAGHEFISITKVDKQQGWRALYRNDVDNEELSDSGGTPVDARKIKVATSGRCEKAVAEEKETQPPALYTMATLLSDLTRVAKYIQDENIRQLLIEKDKDKAGEHGGIGTPATRDNIIKNLFDRGFLVMQGNKIVATEVGHRFYNSLPDVVRYPDMTALWQEKLKAIQAGQIDMVQFVEELITFVEKEINRIKQMDLDLGAGIRDKLNKGTVKTQNNAAKIAFCKNCTSGKLERKKGMYGFFWSCVSCNKTYKDIKGKPQFVIKKFDFLKRSKK